MQGKEEEEREDVEKGETVLRGAAPVSHNPFSLVSCHFQQMNGTMNVSLIETLVCKIKMCL